MRRDKKTIVVNSQNVAAHRALRSSSIIHVWSGPRSTMRPPRSNGGFWDSDGNRNLFECGTTVSHLLCSEELPFGMFHLNLPKYQRPMPAASQSWERSGDKASRSFLESNFLTRSFTTSLGSCPFHSLTGAGTNSPPLP